MNQSSKKRSILRRAPDSRRQHLWIDYQPLSSLQPATRNPKRHSIDIVQNSIRRFGFKAPIIVDERTGRMVAGHGRKQSLDDAKAKGQEAPPGIRVSNGEWLVPVLRGVEFDNDREAEAYLLADNQTTIAGGWNDSELEKILEDLEADDLLGGTGFETFFDDEALREDDVGPLIDHAAELQKKWDTQRGQLWELDKHRLLCGDSTSQSDVQRLMNGRRACLFATDPPYLVDYDGENHPHRWSKSERREGRRDKIRSDKYTDVDRPETGDKLYAEFIQVAVKCAITADAAWYHWHASRRQALLESVWKAHNAFVHQQIIWAKDRPILNRSWYMWQHEPCFFGWVQGHMPKRAAKTYFSSVWSFPTVPSGKPTDHPTAKPIELFAIPMRQHTKPGDLCCEPFSGSGTQLVAAERLGRLCYAMELSPPFVAVALERFSLIGGKPHLAIGD